MNGPKYEAAPGAGARPTLPPLTAPAGASNSSFHSALPPPPPPRGPNSAYHSVAGLDQDSDDDQGLHSGDEDDEEEGVRLGKRKRPLSVS